MPYKQLKFVNNLLELNGGQLYYYPNFAKDNFEEIVNTISWEQGSYQMYGKVIHTPRLLWAMHDANINITNEYKVSNSSEWNNEIDQLRIKVEKFVSEKINIFNIEKRDKIIRYAQLNYYRDGNDYIGWHSDKEMKKNDIVISLSFGSPRKFQLMNIKNNDEKYEMLLEPGSLLIFDTKMGKEDWKHRIPKESRVKDGRINITFRT